MASRKWFPERRQRWIERMLRVYRYINREHLQRNYGISKQQASNDLRVYAKENPTTVRYNRTRKRYESTVEPPEE